jgi:hypothetical protein
LLQKNLKFLQLKICFFMASVWLNILKNQIQPDLLNGNESKKLKHFKVIVIGVGSMGSSTCYQLGKILKFHLTFPSEKRSKNFRS